MAQINATAVWRVRKNGLATNGAGYDPNISGAGTDYTQQDSPQQSWSNLSCTQNSTTLTDASSGELFTSAMVGNAIKIAAGGNWTAGYYFITAYTDGNTVTLSASPATVGNGTSGVGKVGGAADKPSTIIVFGNNTGLKCVAGNVVFVQGAGSDTPSTWDYQESSNTIIVAGISLFGENGRPRIEAGGMIYNVSGSQENIIDGFYFKATGTNVVSSGVMFVSGIFRNNVVDGGSQAGAVGIGCNNGLAMVTFITGNKVINCPGYGIANNVQNYCQFITDNWVESCGTGTNQSGIYSSGPASICNNVVTGCGNGTGASITVAPGRADMVCLVANNTCYNGAADGISVTNNLVAAIVRGNVIVKHLTAAKSAVKVPSSSTSPNVHNNFYYNNTNNYAANLTWIQNANPPVWQTTSNLYLANGDTVLSGDPFTNAASNDFSLNSTAGAGASVRAASPPSSIAQKGQLSYRDGGALQHQDSGGSTARYVNAPIRNRGWVYIG